MVCHVAVMVYSQIRTRASFSDPDFHLDGRIRRRHSCGYGIGTLADLQNRTLFAFALVAGACDLRYP